MQINKKIGSLTRQGSMVEDNLNLEQFLKISNYEGTVRQLDIYYGIGKPFYELQTYQPLLKCSYFSKTATSLVSKPYYRAFPS